MNDNLDKERLMDNNNPKYSYALKLFHKNGQVLFPKKIKNLKTGRISFRVSAGGNLCSDAVEVYDEKELLNWVLESGYSVRASSIDGKTHGLFRLGQRAILRYEVCESN